ncbi:MAG: hypothetical protein ACRC0X_01175 [Brevinema sp.]
MKLFVLFLLCFSPLYTQEKTISPYKFEIGLSGYIANFAFPNIDLDLFIQFYQNSISSLAVKLSTFVLIRGNHFVSPNLVSFGELFELQYRLRTSNGFYMALETGLGPMIETFTKPVFSLSKGFHNVSIPHGVFSFALRLGGYAQKYHNLTSSVVLAYRMQFPFNLRVTHIVLIGVSISFDILNIGD